MASKALDDFDGTHKRVTRGRAPKDVPRDSPGLEMRPDGNTLEVVSISEQIKTLPGLLDAAGIDLRTLDNDANTEFVVERHVVNKWDVHAVIEKAFHRVENWQVKAWLHRREPIAVKFPELKVVDVTLPRAPKAKPCKGGELRRALIIPDSQHGYRRDIHSGRLDPFHDREAWDVAVQIAADMQPDEIILLGDHLDLPDWSDKFVRSPDMYWTTQPALIELAYDIGRLRRACPNAAIKYIEGNHEYRMQRAVFTHMMAAADLRPVDEINARAPALSVERLLCLDSLGVEYLGPYPDGEVWLNENVRLSHGIHAATGSGDTAKRIVQNSLKSEGVGHIHRNELVMHTSHGPNGPRTRMAFSPGTLARLDGPVPGRTKRPNWQNGVGEVLYEPGNGLYQVNLVTIWGGVAIWSGRRYVGEFDVEALRKATGWGHF